MLDQFNFSRLWKIDSLGSNETRKHLAVLILKNKERFINKSKNDIYSYLGKPNEENIISKNEIELRYYIVSWEQDGKAHNVTMNLIIKCDKKTNKVTYVNTH